MLVVVMALPASYGLPVIGTEKPLNLTPDEQALIDMIDYDHAWDQLEYLSSLGEKTAGSPEERAAQEYVYEQLIDMPLDEVWWETFRVANWDHFGTTVTIPGLAAASLPTTADLEVKKTMIPSATATDADLIILLIVSSCKCSKDYRFKAVRLHAKLFRHHFFRTR